MHRHSGIRPKKGSSSHNEPQHVCPGALNIPSPGCGSPCVRRCERPNIHKKIAARKGIVFFKDYWMRDGEKSPTGDHIDLWNMDRLTPSWQNFTRFTLGIGRSPGIYSDLENSRRVVFWPFAG
ncbi:T6SS effector amidase Tae4 family protein [Paracidovorax avenae]|uniref:T6SS effector amidase Tae4 family protein n=1 Tax=Paracidovorax avenae TaxID=80867 RepID=UPI001CEF6AA5|nr:T6SS effector amidase Tae4 family protein [Paracidovorax avenae]